MSRQCKWIKSWVFSSYFIVQLWIHFC